jgi:hypothetical protein
MELELAFGVVNWWAVLAGTLLAFLLGGIWYSPAMFGREGIVAASAESRGGPPRKLEAIFVLAFLMHWLSASLLAAILGPNSTLLQGLYVGLMVGVFFVTTAFVITYIFERRPLGHVLINGGYQVVCLAIMGMIIGAWH